jgi:hypothetical protein
MKLKIQRKSRAERVADLALLRVEQDLSSPMALPFFARDAPYAVTCVDRTPDLSNSSDRVLITLERV